MSVLEKSPSKKFLEGRCSRVVRAIQAQIDRLAVEVDVVRLAAAAGVALAENDVGLAGCCPFHPDAGAGSLVVDAEANRWSCSAGCGSGGPVEWVMAAEGISQRHAVELLRRGVAPTGGLAPRRGPAPLLPAPVDADGEDHVLLAQVAGFYAETLKGAPEALAWLTENAVTDPGVLDGFGLGFANRTLGYRLPQRNRRAGKALRDRLQELGVLRESGHEHFRGCVTVPITDSAGRVVQLFGQRMGRARQERAVAGELWLPGPRGRVEPRGAGCGVGGDRVRVAG